MEHKNDLTNEEALKLRLKAYLLTRLQEDENLDILNLLTMVSHFIEISLSESTGSNLIHLTEAYNKIEDALQALYETEKDKI